MWPTSASCALAGARAFLSRVNATIVALAPHTVRVASEALHFMSLPHPVLVRLFVPVFPIKDISDGCQASGNCTTPRPQQRTFLLQGLFQSQRWTTHTKVSLNSAQLLRSC